jgi:ankyrin repeat protein
MGLLEVVLLLIAHGADLNLRSAIGFTALHDACSANRGEVATALLNAGVDCTILDEVRLLCITSRLIPSQGGRTAYDHAIEKGLLDPTLMQLLGRFLVPPSPLPSSLTH